MKAMIFSATCSPATAIFVMNMNAKEFSKEFPGVNMAVKQNYYMDDYADSANDETEEITKNFNMVEVQRRGGFSLRNWICNSPAVISKIPGELRANNWKEILGDSMLPVERVLGLYWDPQPDIFTFKLNESKLSIISNSNRPWTKREMLRLIASFFDPIGMVAHFLIKVRIIFQNVWREDISWDDPVPSEHLQQWIKWCGQIPTITTVGLPRFYKFPPDINTLVPSGPQLHVSADASQEAYSVVAYLRWGLEGATVSFVFGKSRVAPLKRLTIPRLELTAALLATRVARRINLAHDYVINSTFFWSDSRIALAWVRSGGRRFKQYVTNRVNEILDTTKTHQAQRVVFLTAQLSSSPSYRKSGMEAIK